MKISQSLASIDYIETAGSLGALLKEAQLIKKKLPLYNRRLRRYDELLVELYFPLSSLFVITVMDCAMSSGICFQFHIL